MKKCSKCKISKNTTLFHKSKSRYDGLQPRCKICAKKYSKSKAFIKSRSKYENSPKGKLTKHENSLKRMYGITLIQKQQMFDSQDGKCKICRREFKSLASSCVDHNHKTSRVRGLLCKPCNAYLAVIKEDRNCVTNLLNYLDNDSAMLGD